MISPESTNLSLSFSCSFGTCTTVNPVMSSEETPLEPNLNVFFKIDYWVFLTQGPKEQHYSLATVSQFVLSVYFHIFVSITSSLLHCKVTIDLELHLAKRTKSKSSKGPFAYYDVYLYKVPKTKPRISNGPRASRSKGRVLRWEDDMHPPSPPCSICSPISTHSLPVNELQCSRPWTLSPYTPWQTAPLISRCPGSPIECICVVD